jgi:hypothetical protein
MALVDTGSIATGETSIVSFTSQPDANLPELLAARARGASDGRLVLDVSGGLLAAGAAVLWRPTAWILVLGVALCFAAFGTWGIADRELHDDTRPPASPIARVLRMLRVLAIVVGGVAAVTVLLVGLGVLLGHLQS